MRLAVGRMVTIMVRFVDFGVCLLRSTYICTAVHTNVIIICIKLLSDQPLVLSGNLSEHKHAHEPEHKHGTSV